MKRINNTINKTLILDNIDQVDIFARYFGIDKNDILECIENGKLIPSPVRVDKRASVGFRYNTKRILKMRDFGGFFWGDCFDAVAYVLKNNDKVINISKREDFKFVINAIAIEFNLIDGVNNYNLKNLTYKAKTSKKVISFEVRSWNSVDKRYWIYKYDRLFDVAFLSKQHVYPVERYWIDSDTQPEPKYYYTTKDPCYAYYLGEDDAGYSNIQLYFPKRSKTSNNPRFIVNSNAFSGIINVQNNYDFVVLIKANKDRLALVRILELYSFTGNYNIGVIGYPSENYVMNKDLFVWLLSILKKPVSTHIINFVDFDFTGRRCARIAYDKYNVPFVFITNGEFGLPNHNAKDLTDFIEKYGVHSIVTLIEEYIKTNLRDEYEEEIDEEGGYNATDSTF